MRRRRGRAGCEKSESAGELERTRSLNVQQVVSVADRRNLLMQGLLVQMREPEASVLKANRNAPSKDLSVST